MSAGLAGHWFGPADEEWYHCDRSVSDQLRELMLLRNIAHHGSAGAAHAAAKESILEECLVLAKALLNVAHNSSPSSNDYRVNMRSPSKLS